VTSEIGSRRRRRGPNQWACAWRLELVMAEPLKLYDELTRAGSTSLPGGGKLVPQPPLRSLRALQRRHLLIRNPTRQSSRRQRVRFG
jgi:hypothetical protein